MRATLHPLFTTLHLDIFFIGLRRVNRTFWLHGLRTDFKRKFDLFGREAETTFLCPTDFTDFPGEGWVKSGEGFAQLFTRASFFATDTYTLPVKGEECF